MWEINKLVCNINNFPTCKQWIALKLKIYYFALFPIYNFQCECVSMYFGIRTFRVHYLPGSIEFFLITGDILHLFRWLNQYSADSKDRDIERYYLSDIRRPIEKYLGCSL